jgi:pSer/pThr/pTyr-binding forkhead associated (FHA) protein
MRDGSDRQRAILQVRWGPMAYRKSILEPGQRLRVGRDETMDVSLSHDARLEGAHFELAWDGSRCWIRDLKTQTGTLLDGQPVKEGPVPHGGWIRAGGTESKSEALRALSTQENLYAILDTARSNRILTLLQESVDDHHSLYEGPQGAALAEVAPYLVRLPKGSRLLKSLIQEGWGNSWGVYLTSGAPFKEVRRHFRKFLMVELEDWDGRFYFRFYDPRVLRQFLPTCTAQQKTEVFGPTASFLYETLEEGIPRLSTFQAG